MLTQNQMLKSSTEEYIPKLSLTDGMDQSTGEMDDIRTSVRQIFAEVTRYPLEILETHANLEEDLGIDSVKMGEIFAVLREKYNLPEKMDIPRNKLGSIDDIAQVLYDLTKNVQSADSVDAHPGSWTGSTMDGQISASPSKEGPISGKSEFSSRKEAADFEMMKMRIRQVFADVTRYPMEILDFKADLEEELGIDSVKMGEIFSVLREHYNLPEKLDIQKEKLTTIEGISQALDEYINEGRVHSSDVVHDRQSHQALDQSHKAPETQPEIHEHSEAIVTSFADLNAKQKPFKNKIALITGSGHGIGKEIACYLSALGARVIVNSFHSRDSGIATAEEINAAGGEAIHLWGSVANPKHLDEIFAEIDANYGGLDFFISNASNGMLAKLDEITPEHWEKAFKTNIIGLHQSSLKAVKLMKKRGGGKIITLSSPAAYGHVDYFGCMGAVKAAVDSLTKSMAVEFSVDNVQVNCVSPGPVYGDLLNKWPESDRLISRWESATAYKRLCRPSDVAHFIAYLLSDEVKMFNGSIIFMDGGISARSF